MKANKNLGQHWLTDVGSLEAMCDAGEVSPGDDVLEIGPGLGALTEILLGRGANVTAVEFDERLVDSLKNKISSDKLQLVRGDILNFDLLQMRPGYKVVANIPYYLTSKLLRKLLENSNKPSLIGLLVQKEVAERIVAKPGQLSTLGISAQFYAAVQAREVVPAKFFSPPPKVDSQIVQLRPYEKLPLDVDETEFFRLVKAGFGEKRKKLINSLAGGLDTDKDIIRQKVLASGLNENVRAQELSLEDWRRLLNKLRSTKS